MFRLTSGFDSSILSCLLKNRNSYILALCVDRSHCMLLIIITFFLTQNTLDGDGKLHILFLFFVALMFSISLWSLFGYHLYLTGSNKTTLGKLLQFFLLLDLIFSYWFEWNWYEPIKKWRNSKILFRVCWIMPA